MPEIDGATQLVSETALAAVAELGGWAEARWRISTSDLGGVLGDAG
jgi:hypothetical protein